jgi:hypothetical protein
VDTGGVRGDLIHLARQMLDLYLGETGKAALRIGLEGDGIPGVADRYHALRESLVLAGRAIVRRAIRRGELSPSTSVTLLLDTLVGGAMAHAMTTPPALRAQVVAGADEYAEQLVDFLITTVAINGQGDRGAPAGGCAGS